MVSILRIVLIGAILAAGWNVLHQFVAARISGALNTPEALGEALGWDPRNPDPHFQLGLLYRDKPRYRDLEASRRHLLRACELHPSHWRYWQELGRFYEIRKDLARAEEAYLQAIAHHPRNAGYRWRLANFYLRSGAREESLLNFKAAVQLDFSTYADATLALLWKAGLREPAVESIWPDDPAAGIALLRGLVRHGAAPGYLRDKWNNLMEGPVPPSLEDGAFFLTALLKDDPAEARIQWARLTEIHGLRDQEFQDRTNLVWNGQFELKRTRSPLDWRIQEGEGYKVQTTDTQGVAGSKAIRFDFNGEENLTRVDFQQQLVVEPGAEYRFSFQARSRDLTSDQGIFIQIQSGDRTWTSPPILGTQEWTTSSSTFVIPQNTQTAIIRLGRSRSRKIDSLIGGQLWLDSVVLRRARH